MPNVSAAAVAERTGLSELEIIQAIESGRLKGRDAAFNFSEHDWLVDEVDAEKYIAEHRPRTRGLFGGLFDRHRSSAAQENKSRQDRYVDSLKKIVSGKLKPDELSHLMSDSGRTAEQIEDDSQEIEKRIQKHADLESLRDKHADHVEAKKTLATVQQDLQTVIDNARSHHAPIIAKAEKSLRQNKDQRNGIKEIEKHLGWGCKDTRLSRTAANSEIKEIEQRLALLDNEIGTIDWLSRAEAARQHIERDRDEAEQLADQDFVSGKEFQILQAYRLAVSELPECVSRGQSQNELISERTQLQNARGELKQKLKDDWTKRIASVY